MEHIVVFTGAGVSAESGLRTFRDSNGLWNEHDARAGGFAQCYPSARRNSKSAKLYRSKPCVSDEESGIRIVDLCEKGSQLRPNVVWFGEVIHHFGQASVAVESADIFLVVGTSLEVYPAAFLIEMTCQQAEKYIVNPDLTHKPHGYQWLRTKATEGVPTLVESWKKRKK